jgi:carbamoyltransferase
MAELCLSKYKKNVLLFNGGAAMNVKANFKVSCLKMVKNIYVSPSPGDESLSLGACLYAASKYDNSFDQKNHPFPTIYLGYEITDQECHKVIQRYFSDKTKYKVYRNTSGKEIAGYLVRNLIIGRASDRMEFGARALGNRSIIANPLSFDNIRKMNEKIKLRDFWMPFAPVILKEHEHVYIQNNKKLLSPYMMMSFPTTKTGKEKLAAAKHPYDDTVRPQILSRQDNPAYYDLISEFGAKTGVYALVNTSFNLHGFPIVCTAMDAAKVFLETDLDGLLLNNNLIIKRQNSGC